MPTGRCVCVGGRVWGAVEVSVPTGRCLCVRVCGGEGAGEVSVPTGVLCVWGTQLRYAPYVSPMCVPLQVPFSAYMPGCTLVVVRPLMLQPTCCNLARR